MQGNSRIRAVGSQRQRQDLGLSWDPGEVNATLSWGECHSNEGLQGGAAGGGGAAIIRGGFGA